MPEATWEMMVSARLTIFEHVARDVLIDQLMSQSDPVAAARDYAERRLRPPPSGEIADLEPIRAAVWQQFLDTVTAEISRRVAGG